MYGRVFPLPSSVRCRHTSVAIFLACLPFSLLLSQLLLAPRSLPIIRGSVLPNDIFVSYAFAANRFLAVENLEFFLLHGVSWPESGAKIVYGFTLNGPSPVAESMVQKKKQLRPSSIRIWQRKNAGFDFAAHTFALNHVAAAHEHYGYYVFLNCGAVGPMLPAFMPKDWHWTSAFVEKLVRDIGLVGTSLVCLPEDDEGGYGPKIEGFAFALSASALKFVRTFGTSFRTHENKKAAILDGEYNLTKVLMRGGFGIDTFLLAYQGVNWFDEAEWKCNRMRHPSRHATYHGISLSPLEVMFHKAVWGEPLEGVADHWKDVLNAVPPEQWPVMSDETNLYMKWRNDAYMRTLLHR